MTTGKGRQPLARLLVARPIMALDWILMPNQQPTRSGAPTAPAVIPDKLYFRIGEVAQLCGVAAYVLRFWETEFAQLRPNKSGTGQRLYRRRDVEMAMRIKRLLYAEGYTIPGARQALKSEIKSDAGQPELPFKHEAAPAPSPASRIQKAQLQSLREELVELLDLLSPSASLR